MHHTSMTFRCGMAGVAAVLCLLVSCGPAGIPRVPVRGKITFDGGDWPKPPIFDCAPLKGARGLPATHGSAWVGQNGEFKVDLVPGTYVVNITCWEVEPAPDDYSRAKSYVPKRFENGDAKPKVEVPVGSKGVDFTFDIPKS